MYTISKHLLVISATGYLFICPALAKDLILEVSKNDCRRAVRHMPSADVAYKPGLDVRGRWVGAADVGGGSRIKLPDVFEFNVNVDIRRYLGGPEADAAAASTAAIAADQAKSAVTAASTAVAAAEAAASEAQVIADAASIDLTSITSNAANALAEHEADPLNQEKKDTAITTAAAAASASALAASTSADAAVLQRLSKAGRVAVDVADKASNAVDKAANATAASELVAEAISAAAVITATAAADAAATAASEAEATAATALAAHKADPSNEAKEDVFTAAIAAATIAASAAAASSANAAAAVSSATIVKSTSGAARATAAKTATTAAAEAVAASGGTAVISNLSDGAADTVSAASAAIVSSDANTALVKAFRDAQKYGGLNMAVDKVRFDILTGALTLNGQPLTDPDQAMLARVCQEKLKKGF